MSDTERWRDLALCRPGGGYSPQIWFPENATQIATVQRICAECPVRALCRLAGRGEPFGIWGGELHKGKVTGPSTTREYLEGHGTTGGYARHHRRNEEPCDRCKTAHRIYRASRQVTA